MLLPTVFRSREVAILSSPAFTRMMAAFVCFFAMSAHAALFDDDEARRAILDLRQKMDAAQLRNSEELRKVNEEASQLRRSLLELSNQIEAVRSESKTDVAGHSVVTLPSTVMRQPSSSPCMAMWNSSAVSRTLNRA